jgi:hypothetical protein
MDIKLNEVGTNKPLIITKRSVRGYYKDFLTGEIKVQVGEKEHKVRDSLDEIAYLMGAKQ